MQVAVTPDVVVLFAVLAQAVFAAGLLWLARQNRVPNRFLATIDRTQFGVNYNSSRFFQNLGSYAIRNDFQLAFDLVAMPATK